MLKFEDIVDAPVSKLKTAADDWAKMVTALDRMAEDAQDGMKAKADKAEWEGVNAGVTKGFIGKTANEFKDAAAEAKGVKQILEDAHAAIKKAKDSLISIRDDEGPAAGIHVDAKGKVTARHPLEKSGISPNRDPDYFEMLSQQKKAIEAWQKKIDLIVDNCNDTDVAFKNALEANVAEGHDFSAPKYTNLDQEEAARAAALAAKGRDITHTELQALNELLHDNGNSREFAKNFYEKLGPEKSLAFFGQLSTDTYEYGKVDKERLKDVQALQKNLGLNLATASHDKNFTAEWGPELRKLGTERIPLAKNDYNGPFGYQLLGGIMRYGNYDAKFLNPIAEHVAQLHQKNPDMFRGNSLAAIPGRNPFNPSGVNGSGFDPTVSMLEALGHSPDAAKHFFTDTATAYNEDGTVNKDAMANLGKKDGKAIDNYLDFFGNEKWQNFGDVDTHTPKEMERSLGFMPDALGHALESATLGYPYDSPHEGVTRDADNATVMRSVMEKYGEDAGLLKTQGAISDSLGVMAAGYIDDINWALTKDDSSSVFAPGSASEGRLDFSDVEGRDTRGIARKFLTTLGQHPDAYATVSTAEQIYSSNMLEHQVGPDGKIHEGDARAVVRTGAEVQGVLDQSRADQVAATNVKMHEDYEKAVNARSGWIQFGAGVGVAAGVAFLPEVAAAGVAATLIGLGTDAGSGLVENVVGQFIGDLSDNSVDEHKEKMEQLTRDEKTKVYKGGESMAESPMENFLDRHTTDSDADKKFREDLRESMLIGYGVGNARAQQQGNDPQT
ncbi:hypothetical protein ACIRP2_00465 [Streptomyces sp. NPDC101194]|uniref:hypothetical protein n=1 Tax=Streptomyces sp. NPDC101194 TaxID=3366127 RepID=UPI0037FA6FE0